jgi:hypothetical protein
MQSAKAKVSIATEHSAKYCCVCISVFTEPRGSSQLCPVHTYYAVQAVPCFRTLYIQDLHIEFLHECLDLKLTRGLCTTQNKCSAYVGLFQYFKLL